MKRPQSFTRAYNIVSVSIALAIFFIATILMPLWFYHTEPIIESLLSSDIPALRLLAQWMLGLPAYGGVVIALAGIYVLASSLIEHAGRARARMQVAIEIENMMDMDLDEKKATVTQAESDGDTSE